MRIKLNHDDGNVYEYDENFFTGKKTLLLNGVEATKIAKKEFALPDGRRVNIKGNFMAGVKLLAPEGNQIVMCQNKWYDWLLIFLPLLNIAIGIFCGVIGGGLSGFFSFLGAFLNASILRTDLNIVVKILACIAVIFVTFFVWAALFVLIVGGLSEAFPSIFK